MRKIVFVDHTARLGGGEIALLNLVRHLDHRRFTPVVVLFEEGPLAGLLRAAGVDTRVLPLTIGVADARKDSLGIRSLLRAGDMTAGAEFICKLARFISSDDVHLVHTNSLKSDVIGGLAARMAGVPVIWHLRDRIAEDYLPAKVAGAFRWLSKIVPSRVIAISEAVRRTVDLRPSDRTSVIHDGTTCGESIDRDVHRAADAAPIVGVVGRITPWKGQDVFLRAAADVRRRFPRCRFQIIGAALFDEKEYEQQVRLLAQELGLAEAVEFTGFRSDVPRLLEKLDVLVHASVIGEPFGQVVIEGMAAGKPIVATNGGGIPEIVVDGITGTLVPMGNPHAMADAICGLLADPRQAAQMGRAGRKRVEERFTIQRTARQVEALYDEMLGREYVTDLAIAHQPRTTAATIRSLQIGLEWFPERGGGLDRYYYDLIRQLPEVGVECRGLVVGSPAVAEQSGGAVQSFAPATAPLWKRLLGVRSAAKSLAKNFPAGMLAAHFALYALPALKALSNKPFVFHFHGPWAAESAIQQTGPATSSRASWTRMQIERWVYHRADRLIVLSKAFGQILERDYGVKPQRIRVIPGGIDAQRFATPLSRCDARQALNLPPDRPIIVSVRRLVPRMGLEDLIAASARLIQRRTDALILIAGKGPLQQQLADMIEAKGLSDHVRLLGHVPDETLPLLYRSANISIVPSQALEGFGLVAAESLAAGTPALVTPVGGLPDTVAGLSASLILRGTGADALAEGLLASIDGTLNLPDTAACRRYAMENFDWQFVTRKIRAVYEEVTR